MTIAYIAKMYPRFSETFIVNEILELERQGVDLAIYSLRKPADGRFHPQLADVRAPVIYLPEYLPAEMTRVWAAQRTLLQFNRTRYAQTLGYALVRGNRAALKHFFQASVMAEHILRHPVDALHAHFASSATRVAQYVNRLLDLPYSFTAHAKDIYHQEVNAELLRDKIRAARFVVTVSEFNRRHLEALMGTDAARDIRVLYNGIDLQAFQPAALETKEPGLILGVGRLVEKKGFDVLIRACAQLAARGLAFHCEIVGQGPLQDALGRLIVELSLQAQVKLVGAKPQDQVRASYRRASIFALPCMIGKDGNRDGLPTVLLEAMAMGLPPVSTAVTGVPEIIDDGINGLLVPQQDADTLADALARLVSDVPLRARLGANARTKIERTFDIRQNVAILRHWLTEPRIPNRESQITNRLLPIAINDVQ